MAKYFARLKTVIAATCSGLFASLLIKIPTGAFSNAHTEASNC